MSDDKTRVFIFLDKEIGIGSDCTFEDYDSKEDILQYAIELVEENDSLTAGCGVGPLMEYIAIWIEQFEAESENKETLKYELKLIKELEKNKFFSKENEPEIKIIAKYLYSQESQIAMLKQVLKQIELDKIDSLENIDFQLKKNNELGAPILEQMKIIDKKALKFLNEFINKEFKLLLEDNIKNLISAFNVKDLKDLTNKKLKM